MTSPPFPSLLDDTAADNAARSVREALGLRQSDGPPVGVILGSGLGTAADRLLADGGFSIAFSAIPGMPVPHVSGHAGRLVAGQIDGKGVMMLQGRVHHYEGHSPEVIVFGTRLLGHLGIRTLIVTNAAGAIVQGFAPGDLMLISDHLRPLAADLNMGQLLLQPSDLATTIERRNTCLWNSRLRSFARQVSTPLRIHEGVYAMMTGPAYETAAEIRMMRHLGADVVGMSTIPEAMFAASRGIEVLGISCITNIAAGLSSNTLDHAHVTATASSIGVLFVDWLWQVIKSL